MWRDAPGLGHKGRTRASTFADRTAFAIAPDKPGSQSNLRRPARERGGDGFAKGIRSRRALPDTATARIPKRQARLFHQMVVCSGWGHREGWLRKAFPQSG